MLLYISRTVYHILDNKISKISMKLSASCTYVDINQNYRTKCLNRWYDSDRIKQLWGKIEPL